ncbi:MAG: polysaccharide pyruvyl transferase family protein [Planctomycetota bacterium]|jgi:colanic acid/amylovoran biosynthesis protein
MLKRSEIMTGKNVVILGGDLANKGAQAMTLTVVDQIRRRFPDKDVYLFSTSAFEREDSVKGAYNFGFLPWTSSARIKLLFGPLARNRGRHSRKYGQIKEVLQGTSFIIDVSGYVLSSQWGLSLSLGYLANILIAKKYSIPFYIFPQSLGPFDYPLMQKLILYPLLRLCLVYPRIIFVREREGLKQVRRFTKRNVKQSGDVVLQNPGYDVANIYIRDMSLKAFDVKPNSVAIIPNMRVVDRVGPEKLDAIWRRLHSIYRQAQRRGLRNMQTSQESVCR